MKVHSVKSLQLVFLIAAIGFEIESPAQLTLKVLHSFGGGIDGEQPYAGLVQGTDGALYGTTYLGGSNRAGTVFKINPNGSENTPLFHFGNNSVDPFGLASPSGLIQGADGALYGTTAHGGSDGYGSVFRINPNGSGYAVLHSFDPSGGYSPNAALVQGRDGSLFGTTQSGGAGFGTVFRLNTNGGFTQLYAFGSAANDPQSPQSPLIQGADGALYGTSHTGGTSAVGGASGFGTVFKINTNGTGMTVLHNFMPSGGDGQNPYLAGLVQGSNGVLYGITQEGGSFANGGSSGFGTVFKINPDGTGYEILHSFDPAAGDGKYPNSALVLGNDGALYGNTEFGGSNNLGVVFRLRANGSQYEVLYHFGSATNDGSYPRASLVRAADGGLFGTAQFGGEKNLGVIFRLGPTRAAISSIKPVAGGMEISFAGTPHFEYRLEGSTNQVDWVALTNLHNETGLMQFTDPDTQRFSMRFYRAAWVP